MLSKKLKELKNVLTFANDKKFRFIEKLSPFLFTGQIRIQNIKIKKEKIDKKGSKFTKIS